MAHDDILETLPAGNYQGVNIAQSISFLVFLPVP